MNALVALLRTGPLAALGEVDGSPAQGGRAQYVTVGELHGEAGDAEHDDGDQQEPELFEHAVGGHGRSGRGRRGSGWRRHGAAVVGRLAGQTEVVAVPRSWFSCLKKNDRKRLYTASDDGNQ